MIPKHSKRQKQSVMNATATNNSSGIRLFRVRDIQIRLDYSWLIVFALVLWSLSGAISSSLSESAHGSLLDGGLARRRPFLSFSNRARAFPFVYGDSLRDKDPGDHTVYFPQHRPAL